MKDLVFHHIGYATNSIKETSSFYLERGYKASEIIYDEVQQTNICFLTKVGNPTIELIEPATEKSSIHKILKKMESTLITAVMRWKILRKVSTSLPKMVLRLYSVPLRPLL